MSTDRKHDSLATDLSEMMGGLTKGWKREKKRTDKTDRLKRHQFRRLCTQSKRITIREVAFKHMKEAYNKASANGKYWANARQIFYAARPLILKEATVETLDSVYFTQTLLKDYLEEYSPSWKVVWDARGHFREPHTDTEIGVGGVDVLDYIKKWKGDRAVGVGMLNMKPLVETKGPHNRFSSVLFIEKEGFDEILTEAKIGKKYDMAIMSTKGVPTKAACDLLCSLAAKGVKVFALHDFDVSGFKILRTLEMGTRLAKGVEVTDLGLRLEDIKGLESEPFTEHANADYLESCGCTEEEIEFLQRGERVELNAMTSDHFIEWLEDKLWENGIKRVIPGSDVMRDAYRRAYFAAKIEERLEETKREAEGIEVPSKLVEVVTEQLAVNAKRSWDEVVWEIAHDDLEESPDEDGG